MSLITEQVDSRWLIVPGVYKGYDFTAMAVEAVGDRRCTIIDTSGYGADPVLRLPRGDASALAPVVDPGHTVRWYYYSSGTTATPKGAMHTDASTVASSNAQIVYVGMSGTDLFPLAFPISHIGGIMLLTTYLRVGASLLFLETFDPVASPPIMAAAGATVLGSATPLFRAYLAAQRRHGDEPLFPKLHQLQASVADVTVVGLPDERTGERACAIVVLAQGVESLTIPELAQHCIAAGLSKLKIPEQLEIVEGLPRNPMGKVLKHVLRAQLLAAT